MKGVDCMGKMSMKAARVNIGLTQKEAAKALKVSNKTLGSWENGLSTPKAIYIDNICELYKISYDELNFLPANSL